MWPDETEGLTICVTPGTRIAPGTRIEVLEMADDPDPLPAGTTGTVRAHVSMGNSEFEQLWVDWDIDRTLCLLPTKDRFRILETCDSVGSDNPPEEW